MVGQLGARELARNGILEKPCTSFTVRLSPRWVLQEMGLLIGEMCVNEDAFSVQ